MGSCTVIFGSKYIYTDPEGRVSAARLCCLVHDFYTIVIVVIIIVGCVMLSLGTNTCPWRLSIQYFRVCRAQLAP